METLSTNFKTVGEACEWCGNDYSDKIPGLGPAMREKLQNAIDNFAGVTDEAILAEAERGKAEREL